MLIAPCRVWLAPASRPRCFSGTINGVDGNAHRPLQGLVGTGQSPEMLFGHDQRGGSLHGQQVENPADRPHEQDHVNEPEDSFPQQEQHRQAERK